MPTPRSVSFDSRGIQLFGHLYEPPTASADRRKAAIVVGHPFGGVKEQTAGLHARQLAQAGFVALAFDAAYNGESGGSPRNLEDPYQRADDLRNAVSYLSTLDGAVDPSRIGVLGICASGGYVPFAAQSDPRMRAVATVSAACFGDLTRNGNLSDPAAKVTPAQLAGLLEMSADARTQVARGGEVQRVQHLPDDEAQVPKDLSPTGMMREAWDYYKTPRGQHPMSTQHEAVLGIGLRANYDSFAFNHLISPRPLLMIVGENADTRYQSERAMEKAKEPKELYVVPGRTHVGLYDNTSGHMQKLVDFMAESLCK
ncbi:hypothetical protein NLU13_5068 [Sarocladium strictum]|uniref:Dienelactone hydrolase domain-containing protein n=1 Tax=Sarocladium strictum TaxID=5046 RepID=A0AA39GK25_SARSR|nr:hypothetical protein NLU13_5068 [Sarocladium strictum]